VKTIEEARAEAAQYATQGFTLTEHMSLILADEPMSTVLTTPYFVQLAGAWYAGGIQFASLRDALAACEAVNDGSMGRRIAEASRRARGAAEQPPRPALPPSIDLAELWAENERLRAVAKTAMASWETKDGHPREIARARAALEDALGRLHDQDLDGSRWRTLPTVDHAPAVGFGASRTIARAAAAQAAAVTLDADPPEDLLDATRSAR
jgi:hypothetical protein